MLTNSASARADEAPAPVSDTGSLQVAALTDLSITKSGAATYTAGSEYTWQLRVRNLGPSDAQNASISDPLPAGTILLGADAPCVLTTATVSCALGSVPAGFDHTYAITVAVDPGVTAATLDNTATVATTTPDSNPANDRSTFGPAAHPIADVSVTKTADPGAILEGHETTFTLTAGNAGPSTARDVSLVDTLPAGLAFVSADGPGCANAAGTHHVPDRRPGTRRERRRARGRDRRRQRHVDEHRDRDDDHAGAARGCTRQRDRRRGRGPGRRPLARQDGAGERRARTAC